MELLLYPSHKDGQLSMLIDNHKLEFTNLAKQITTVLPKVGISKSFAIVDLTKIGREYYVSEFGVIGDNSTIGDNTVKESKSKFAKL